MDDPHQRIPVHIMRLTEFSQRVALNYLKGSSISASLDLKVSGERDSEGRAAADDQESEEKQKLVLLTRGHPLWLAFAISYLKEKGMPEEVTTRSLEEIKRDIPYRGEMSIGWTGPA